MSQFRRSALILLILGGLFVPLGDGWTAEGTAGEAQPASGTAEQIKQDLRETGTAIKKTGRDFKAAVKKAARKTKTATQKACQDTRGAVKEALREP